MKITWKKWGSLLLALALVLSLVPPAQATPAREETVLSQGEKIPVALAVTATPDKLTYMEYTEELDVTGGQIKVYWNDGTSEVMDMTREMVTGFDNTKPGTQTLTVTYGPTSATFQVEVVAKTAQSIAVTRLPWKLTYVTTYEELDVTGGEITVTYADGTPAKVIPMTREMVTGFDNTQLGPQTLTVTYAGAETTYEVEIVEATPTRISVSQLPEQTVYLWNVDSLNLEGATIKLYFNNNTSSEIPITPEMVTGFDNTREGTQNITVTYQGKTTAFQVTVEKSNTTQFASGLGTKEWPYIILTKEHLNNVRLYLNSHFKMIDDIVFTEADFQESGAFYNNGQGWEPIGAYSWNSSTSFTGTFDGDGHTITGLKISIDTFGTVHAGLFGYVENGTIANLGMENSEFLENDTGNYSYIGGIAGYVSDSFINNCYNTGAVSSSNYDYSNGGGITGYAKNSTISNCYNTGIISNFNTTGGITGHAEKSTISSCYNISTISAGECAGGIVGDVSHCTITNCYNTCTVSAYYSVGGIAGNVYEDVTITSCYNIGAISASTDAGGIAGEVSESFIINCYNTGAVSTVDNWYAGGIAGEIRDSSDIKYCYNTGAVSNSDSYFSNSGGIVGYAGESTISNCYYLNSAKEGIGSGICPDESISCSVSQMREQCTFQDFDFESVWTMEGSPEYGYPELIGVTTVSLCQVDGHTTIKEGEKAPTCSTEGYTGDIYCLGCGLLLEQGTAIPVLDFTEIYRVYNPGNGKHHYTADAAERDALVAGGWSYEGIAWNAPKEGKPIYRVYHPATGNHLYTMDGDERDFLAANGWNYEGILCYSAESDGVPLYRVCNPYTDRNPHHYTDSLEECAFLESNGWRIEGISWYGLSK